jgi:hypothetical protein
LQLTGSAATFAAWIKPESLRAGTGASSRNIILADTNNSIIFTLQDSGRLTCLLYTGTGSKYKTMQVDASNAVTAGTWTHVAAVMDGVNMYLYVNGIPVKSSVWSIDYTALGNLSIGGAQTIRNLMA